MFEKIAAIDLFDGRVVRLKQGNYEMVTEYGDPYAIASSLDQSDFDRIHIINLNGARGEVYRNLEIISRLAKRLKKPLQVGGGVRKDEDARRLLGLGVDLIVSTLFFEDPMVFENLVNDYPGRILLSLDLKDGIPMTRGWLEATSSDAIEEIAAHVNALPLKGIIVTNISRDGTLEGVDSALFNRVYEPFTLPLYAAGGVSSLEDLTRLEEMGYRGAIIGRALYEGVLDKGGAPC